MNLKDKITITISSNRSNFDRIFNNFSNLNCSKILVHLSNVDVDCPEDWEYIRVEDLNHYQRHRLSINKVKTPYVLEAAEDDYYFIDFIEKSIYFLDNNEDYVSCRGAIFGYNGKKIDYNQYISKVQSRIYPKLLEDQFYSNDPIERLNYHLDSENMFNPSRNIKRVDSQKKFMDFLNSHEEYWRLNYIDRLYLICESLYGNIKTLEGIQLLKNSFSKTTVEKDLYKNGNTFSPIFNHLENLLKWASNTYNLDKVLLEKSIRMVNNKMPTSKQRWEVIEKYLNDKKTLIENEI